MPERASRKLGYVGTTTSRTTGNIVFVRNKPFTLRRTNEAQFKYHNSNHAITKEDLQTENLIRRLLKEKNVKLATSMALKHIESIDLDLRASFQIFEKEPIPDLSYDNLRSKNVTIFRLATNIYKLTLRMRNMLQYVPSTNPIKRKLINQLESMWSNKKLVYFGRLLIK